MNGLDEADFYINGDSLIDGLIEDAITETSADLIDVLIVTLRGIERIAHDAGIEGSELLRVVADDRLAFRGEIEASASMRGALQKVLDDFKDRK